LIGTTQLSENNTMNNLDSTFIPVLKDRLTAKDLESEILLFTDKNLFVELLDSTSSYLVILNEYRQILYASKTLKYLLKNKDVNFIYGKRPGEVLNCKNAFLTVTGCGTSKFCDTCGALKVILSSLKGKEDIQECRIIKKDTIEAVDLKVWAKPLETHGKKFSIFNFSDISNEKRRLVLERIFFHDVLNSAGGLSSYISLFKNSSREQIEEMVPLVSYLTDKLMEEINAHRDLTNAENSELNVNIQNCNTIEIITNVVKFYNPRFNIEEKGIEVDLDCDAIVFNSDEILISRVLSNMVKNALESTKKGDNVKIGCHLLKDKIQFTVNNPGCIPPAIQHQIFQRSFSTKGVGRGLGTYSMKLISERYLKGKIYFTTSEENGTTFIAEYPVNFNLLF
jgi:hypothetical protein